MRQRKEETSGRTTVKYFNFGRVFRVYAECTGNKDQITSLSVSYKVLLDSVCDNQREKNDAVSNLKKRECKDRFKL